MTSLPAPAPCVAVVIPCYRCLEHVGGVIARIPAGVAQIWVVDDACPDGTGAWVQAHVRDDRVRVIRLPRNEGVGGAVMTGYQAAARAGADILVKIDGDGQMDPAMVAQFVGPIAHARADYTKGNRFYALGSLASMPRVRLVGNALLSFMAKLSTGYWGVFDVTNGYTALHARLLPYLELDKVSRRYFFESDLLFRLGTVRAVVVDVPMPAHYGNETSHLRVGRIVHEFTWKHLRNFAKRIGYSYFLRDMTLASLELVVGLGLLMFGVVFGTWKWWEASSTGLATPLGTIMLAALPTLLGIQFLLAFMGHDVANQPRQPVHPLLPDAVFPPSTADSESESFGPCHTDTKDGPRA